MAYRRFLKKTGRGFHEVQEEEQERLGGDTCKEEQERVAKDTGRGGGEASIKGMKRRGIQERHSGDT